MWVGGGVCLQESHGQREDNMLAPRWCLSHQQSLGLLKWKLMDIHLGLFGSKILSLHIGLFLQNLLLCLDPMYKYWFVVSATNGWWFVSIDFSRMHNCHNHCTPATYCSHTEVMNFKYASWYWGTLDQKKNFFMFHTILFFFGRSRTLFKSN